MRFLLLTLYAPLASFGGIAVGVRRMGMSRPGRSAVLGLVAGALGYERTSAEQHAELDRALGYAVRTDRRGRSFLDYHTAQAAPARRGFAPRTRREELEVTDLKPILSTREWRMDAFHTAALWKRRDGGIDLETIREAIARPCFTPYLGRKSAVFGLPLSPRIVDAGDVTAALSVSRGLPEQGASFIENVVLRHLEKDGIVEIAADRDAPGVPGDATIIRRRDVPLGRTPLQFTERDEAIWALSCETRE